MATRLSIVWSLLTLVGSAISQNTPVVPSNTSSYNPNANANVSAVMVTTQLNNPVPLFALTDFALSQLTTKQLSTTSPGTELVDITQNSTHLIPDEFVYISCDPDAWPGDITFGNTVNSAIQANVSAIIFYSVNASFCTLNGTLPSNYRTAYSTINTANATNLMQHLTGMFGSKDAQAMLLTQAEYNNAVASSNDNGGGIGGSSPSTAVAMIILYSITGIITALFLLIIVTGAIRAHRHPERYGPRNVMGRPRQGRAKGIARAMLDTIPIVKFNATETTDKNSDVELQNNRNSPSPDHNETTEETRQVETEVVPESSTEHAVKPTEEDEQAPAIQELPDEDKNGDNSLGCSICTEDFEEGQDLRVLPCKHRFHPACVDPWLLDVSGTCPLCRVDLRPTNTNDPAAEGTTTTTGNEASEGESALPPPLDPPGPSNSSRRGTLRAFFDRRRLNASTREERLAAIRDYRQQQQQRQSRAPASADGQSQTAEQERVENEGRWRRVRRSLRFGPNVNIASGGEVPSTPTTTTTTASANGEAQ